MRSFDQLLGLLSNIPDPRRAEGKLYKLPTCTRCSLDPRCRHRRQFLPLHRDLHQSAPPPIRTPPSVCTGGVPTSPYLYSIYPPGRLEPQ